MTVWTLQAPMPAADVAAGMTIRLEAVDPTTGAAVTGVTATAWAIYGLDVSAATSPIEDIIPRLSDDETAEA